MLKIKTVPASWAALTDPHSPSGWAIFCKALGDIPIGMEISFPKTVVFKFVRDTSTNILGRNLYLIDGNILKHSQNHLA